MSICVRAGNAEWVKRVGPVDSDVSQDVQNVTEVAADSEAGLEAANKTIDKLRRDLRKSTDLIQRLATVEHVASPESDAPVTESAKENGDN